MSLINEALKRAKAVQQQNPPPVPDLQFRPIEAAPEKSALTGLLAATAVLAVLASTLFFVWRSSSQRTAAEAAAKGADTSRVSRPVAVQQPAKPFPSPEPTPAAPLITKSEPAATLAEAAPPATVTPTAHPDALLSTSTADTTPAANKPAIAGDPVALKPATPKLQGILYRPDRPAAVIGGKTLFLGDRVGDFRVCEISRESVTLAGTTQTNTLTLEQ